MATERPTRAPADIAPVAALFADPSRARIVTALIDGRGLPASVLSDESGVSASTTSQHLSRLVAGGVLTAERSGRHRYYRLANRDVAAAVEALAVISPQPPVRSLRESTRAAALRRARTCYDHLAGRLGVAVTEALLDQGALARGDGVRGTERGATDGLATPVREHAYQLGPRATDVFAQLGVDLADVSEARRPLLRFCVDWSEQRHHLAGGLGAAVFASMEGSGWVRRESTRRAIELTRAGRDGLGSALGLSLDDAVNPGYRTGRAASLSA